MTHDDMASWGRAGPGYGALYVVLFLVPYGGPYEAVFVYNMGLQKDPLSGLPFRKGFAGGPPAGVLLREAESNKKHRKKNRGFS